MIKKIISIIFLIIVAYFMFFYNSQPPENQEILTTENKTEEELIEYAKDYFSTEHVEGIDPEDEGNTENSGGIVGLYIENIDEIYEQLPFAVAIELENQLINSVYELEDTQKDIENLGEDEIEEYYSKNNEILLSAFGIATKEEFEKLIVNNKFPASEPQKINVFFKDINLTSFTLDATIHYKNSSITYTIDALIDKNENIYMYWR